MVLIREYESGDFKEFLLLNNEWYTERVSQSAIKHSEYSMKKELKNSTVFLAFDAKILAGFLVCKVRVAKETNNVHNLVEGEKYVDLDSVYVRKGYRDKGLGTKLLKHFLTEIKRVGYKKIIVSADSVNMSKLVHFYEKQKFKVLFTRLMLEFK